MRSKHYSKNGGAAMTTFIQIIKMLFAVLALVMLVMFGAKGLTTLIILMLAILPGYSLFR